MRWLRSIGLSVGIAGALMACAGGGDPPAASSCPNVNPTCPTTSPPTFEADVQPILKSRCYGCHAPGGVGALTENLTTYQGVKNADIVNVLANCSMPPADAGPLTVGEITTLLDWNACGGLNN